MVSYNGINEEDNGRSGEKPTKRQCKRHCKNSKNKIVQRGSAFYGVSRYAYTCLFCLVIIHM